MQTRTIGIWLSLALATSAPVFAQGSQSAAPLPTEAEIVQAAALQSSDPASTALDQLIMAALGENPDAERIQAIQSLLDTLAASNPLVAARTAASVAKAALQILKTKPNAAIKVVMIAVETLSNQNLIDKAPAATAAALIETGRTLGAMKSLDGVAAIIKRIATLIDDNPSLQRAFASANPGSSLAETFTATVDAQIATAAGQDQTTPAPAQEFTALEAAENAVVIPTDEQTEVSPAGG